MMRLEKIIEIIKQRPAMYIGKLSIVRFAMFLQGYIFANNEFEENTKEDVQNILPSFNFLLREYNSWIAFQYKESGVLGWENILLSNTKNEEEALTLFFQTWEQFLADPDKEKSTEKLRILIHSDEWIDNV